MERSADDATDAPTPWYRDGLRFECTGCGACCSGSGYVWVTDEELTEIATLLGRAVGEVRLLDTRPVQGRITLREHKNGECIYLDPATKQCRVYAARPRQCRTWPFWPTNLSSRSAWERTGENCPGINTGDLVPLDVIEKAAENAGTTGNSPSTDRFGKI